MTEQPGEHIPTPSRSKRIYVLWGVALALLLTGGLLCWKVVVPVWRVRTEVQACREQALRSTVSRLTSKNLSRNTDGARAILTAVNEAHRSLAQASIARLGGAEVAARKLALYLSMPGMNAVDRRWAVVVLENCGQCAESHLDKLAGDEDPDVRQAAAEALKKIKAAQEKK